MRIWRIAVMSVLVPVMLTGAAPFPATAAVAVAVADKADKADKAEDARQAVRQKAQSLVKLRRQGGFAGVDDRVTVYTDGCARVVHRTGPAITRCLSAADTRTLRGDLKRLSLGRSQTAPPGADMYRYTLTYHGRSVSRSSVPASWRPVVRRLEKLLDARPAG
ncbi:hypothetical protein DQ384_19780 [Sphaerisporangium album]|uniref:Secreted protein n=1 Tax=Sphaerisporangium album TaxID=509200 RepID=A0A367FHF7_9ACTN|nr:protealysin inhibitor emfourin [Sphaerisporangium album]RCG29808.1 hypothetical protein DQ384_19780 [Sphaerisporangium album]